MCFTYQTGFEPKASNRFGSEVLIILILDPDGTIRATTLRGSRDFEPEASLHQRKTRRGKGKTAASGREGLTG